MPRPLVALPDAMSVLALLTASSSELGQFGARSLLVKRPTFSTAQGTP
jgi:hypothetical protein